MPRAGRWRTPEPSSRATSSSSRTRASRIGPTTTSSSRAVRRNRSAPAAAASCSRVGGRISSATQTSRSTSRLPGPESSVTPPNNTDKAQRVAAEGELVLGWRPAIGQEVPNTKWVLKEKLGEGGFGEVWKARHEKLDE